MNSVVITQYKNFICSGYFHDFELLECDFSPLDKQQISVGDVYVGRVEKVVPGIEAAFIQITLDTTGYYSLHDNTDHCFLSPKNTCKLCAGDKILVQVEKEAVKTKPVTLSSRIALSGAFCVASTDVTGISVSRKFHSTARKNELKTFLSPLLPGKKGGIIVRTNAENEQNEVIWNEAQQLLEQLNNLLVNACHRTFYSKLLTQNSPCIDFIRNFPRKHVDKILTDIPHIQKEVEAAGFTCKLYEDNLISLSHLYNLEKQIERACGKKVWLNCGGYLLIEPTEALTVIDVNTGKYEGKSKNNQEVFYKTNLQAVREIGKQLRLRNISGIIVIDFINMEQEEAQANLLKELKEVVKEDRITTVVMDITRLGLVEVTRKKVKRPISELF